jgi:hypothetical protein
VQYEPNGLYDIMNGAALFWWPVGECPYALEDGYFS